MSEVPNIGKPQLNTSEQHRFQRRDLFWIALALLLAAAVRIVFFGGIYAPDELNYLRCAAEWMSGSYALNNALFIHDTRLIMFVPIAWSFSAFGVSEATAILWPFFASLVVVVFVYLIALRLFNRETAVYSVFFAVLLPLLVQDSIRLFPGAVMNLMIALSAYCYLVSERVARSRWVWLTIAGVIYGLIQMAGELGIVFGCFFLAAFISWRRYSLWTYWPLAASFAGVIALTAIYYWIGAGDPLLKIGMSNELVGLIKTVAPRQPFYFTKVMLAPFIGGAGVFYIAGIGFIAGVLKRRREALFLTLWIAITWAVMEFGSVSLSEYRQVSKSVRYFSVVSVPTVILAGWGMAWIRQTLSRRYPKRAHVLSVGAIALLFILVAGLSARTLQSAYESRVDERAGLRKIRDQVRRYEGKPIYVTNCRWNTRVGFFMRFEKEYLPSGYAPFHAVNLETADSTSLNRYVQTLKPGEPMGPGILIQDEIFFRASQGETYVRAVGLGEIPEVLAHTPPEWRLIERVADAQEYDVTLYEIPKGARWPAVDGKPPGRREDAVSPSRSDD